MKNILSIVLVAIFFSCTEKKENANSNIEINKQENLDEVVLINPCDLVSIEDIATTFGADVTTMESYTRNPYPDTNRCEFTWNVPQDVTKASQIMITISSNLEMEDMPRKFSNILRMDKEKGVLGSQQQIIKPTPIDGFGTNGYHWVEPDFQNVQKIKFQLNEAYLVEVLFNSSGTVNSEEIKEKLLQIGKNIKQKI
ncbi:hypothetical protein LXD69_08625 [Flavobacterium sediminilitoris]|uniref:Lipoprotein n=1 Tax=Flavobacterium sediminilitoris TaxID=2024526 RepID=A0ABY4HSA8_9FLAO|nr:MULTISPECIES: hypothetical protein [Flavobacterium]UOX35575.1 hypothetical protein LXD69_08625 [Flavobacterium sediminilitoris]